VLTGRPEFDGNAIDDVVAYITSLPTPAVGRGDASVFNQVGCDVCHTPTLGGYPLYSDLLLHNLGNALDDGFPQANARGKDWRTTPLWGLSSRARLLHDGRARSVEAAILAHGGEADAVVQRFRGLSAADRTALLAFLHAL
jgi:CxxC motif-containing protein (DUF1111 family)